VRLVTQNHNSNVSKPILIKTVYWKRIKIISRSIFFNRIFFNGETCKESDICFEH
jgi:hypothetical protein